MNKTPALKVPLQTELRFRLRRYEQPPTLEGLRSNRKPQAAHRRPKSSSDNDLCSERPNSSNDDLRADAAAIRPSPTSPLEGRGQAIEAKEPRPGARTAAAIPSVTRTSPATCAQLSPEDLSLAHDEW